MSDAQTFYDIIKASTVIPATFVDDDTPSGQFGVTCRVLGITTTYFCQGEIDDPDAPIVSRIEHDDFHSRRYVGDRLKGGELRS